MGKIRLTRKRESVSEKEVEKIKMKRIDNLMGRIRILKSKKNYPKKALGVKIAARSVTRSLKRKPLTGKIRLLKKKSTLDNGQEMRNQDDAEKILF